MKTTRVKVPEIGTKEYVRFFEKDQKQFGTETAISNLLWTVAADIMKQAGVKNIKTTYYKTKGRAIE